MTDPTVAGGRRHHVVLDQLRRDLHRDHRDRDVLATEITLSAVALALDAAIDTSEWATVRSTTRSRLASLGLDETTVAAFENELIRAAGGPPRPVGRPTRSRWRRRR